MHQKKSDLQIGEESSSLSSDFSSSQPVFHPPIHQKHLQIQTQYQSNPHQSRNHLKIQIPSRSSLQHPSSIPSTPTHQNFNRTHFHNQPIFNNPSTNKTLLLTPHKRPILSQTPSSLSHSPTLSSLHHYHNTTVLNSEPSRRSHVCSFSFAEEVALATKTISLKLCRHFRHHIQWLRVHLRLIILLFLPSLYFITTNQGNTFYLHFLSILAFSATLVILLNLGLPCLPSIRSLIAPSSPIKLSSTTPASKPRPPVVWSIGSKTKSEKRPHSGSWVQVHSNGDVYEGEFHKGKCSGSGVYCYYMSGRYEGDWVNDKYDGYGVETWAKGSRYRGQYLQGLRHGFGVYRFYTGDVYAGEWFSGHSHGSGIYTCEDGSLYLGEFKRGVKHGLGQYNFRNGDSYAGEYFADKMHGFGLYCFGNGHCYEGAWYEGRKQGLGLYTFSNGATQSGHWQNGVLNISSIQGTLPGSTFAISHSKVLNAVQEARRAAERAVNVAKVDERVNKAVAAANKTANAARVAAVKAVQNQMHHNNNNNDVPISIV